MEGCSFENVSFSYPETSRKAIENVTFDIGRGDFFVLFGASGCGKSTLLRLIKPETAPHGTMTGKILLDGIPADGADRRTRAEKIGFIGQSPENQIVCDKVWHEMAFGLESLGTEQQTMRARVAETASFFGIENWFHKNVSELSGGQKQLLVLASVIVTNPDLLILDEPTAQLDPIAAAEFVEMLAKINRELGVTVIMAEHRLEEVLPYCTRTALMENCTVSRCGTPEDIAQYLAETKNPLFSAMPAPVRIAKSLSSDSDKNCPMTVRDGSLFVEKYAETHEYNEIIPEKRRFGDAVLSASELTFRYERELPDVVREFSFSLHRGEFFAVLGGNGAGKSTVLKLLSGIKKAQFGTVTRNGKIGLLPQEPRTVFTKKTVREDLLSVLPRSMTREEKNSKTAAVCEKCGLNGLENRHPFDLSGGEMQRAALAKILLTEPDILLLDEPTKGMDAFFKRNFAKILSGLLQSGHAVMAVSHDVGFCAEYADTVALFFDGSVVSCGTASEIFSQNRFYTTAASRTVKSVLPHTVTVGNAVRAFGKEEICGEKRTLEIADFEYKSNADDEKTKDETKPKKPSLPRVCAGVFFAAVSLAVFIYAVSVTDLSKMITSSGITDAGRLELAIYAVFSVSLFGAVMCFGQKSEKPVMPENTDRRLSRRTLFACVPLLILIPITLFIGVFYFGNRSYGVLSVILLFESMLPFFAVFEGRRPQAREIVIIAVLCGLGIAGRAAFFMLPQFKPVMALTIIAGVAFGGETGFIVGAVTMLVSNMLFSQGPWTPWQMFSMGIIGFVAGILFRKGFLRRSRVSLCIFGGLSAVVIYGGIMNPASVLIWTPASFGVKALLASYLSGFPMDLIHGAATVIFLAVFAEPMLEKLDRVKTKYGIIE